MDIIKVGTIVNTHALKGELKVYSVSDFNKMRFKKGNELYISYRKQYEKVTVQSYREQKGMVFVSFVGLNDINMVEKYKNCDLYVDREDIEDLDTDEVYYHDLMNCEVYDEENNLLGNVEDILETGANAVLRVNKSILIPFVDAFIKDVDIENKRIVIHKMEGLLWE